MYRTKQTVCPGKVPGVNRQRGGWVKMPTEKEKLLAEAINTTNFDEVLVYVNLAKLGVTDAFQVAYWTATLDAVNGVEVKAITDAVLLIKFEEGHCESVTIKAIKKQLLVLMGSQAPAPSPTH